MPYYRHSAVDTMFRLLPPGMFVLGIAVIVGLIFMHRSNRRECEARGGVYLRADFVCLTKDMLK